MSFDWNSKDNITVARSHLVLQVYLKDNILLKSKNMLLLWNLSSLGAKRENKYFNDQIYLENKCISFKVTMRDKLFKLYILRNVFFLIFISTEFL